MHWLIKLKFIGVLLVMLSLGQLAQAFKLTSETVHNFRRTMSTVLSLGQLNPPFKPTPEQIEILAAVHSRVIVNSQLSSFENMRTIQCIDAFFKQADYHQPPAKRWSRELGKIGKTAPEVLNISADQCGETLRTLLFKLTPGVFEFLKRELILQQFLPLLKRRDVQNLFHFHEELFISLSNSSVDFPFGLRPSERLTPQDRVFVLRTYQEIKDEALNEFSRGRQLEDIDFSAPPAAPTSRDGSLPVDWETINRSEFATFLSAYVDQWLENRKAYPDLKGVTPPVSPSDLVSEFGLEDQKSIAALKRVKTVESFDDVIKVYFIALLIANPVTDVGSDELQKVNIDATFFARHVDKAALLAVRTRLVDAYFGGRDFIDTFKDVYDPQTKKVKDQDKLLKLMGPDFLPIHEQVVQTHPDWENQIVELQSAVSSKAGVDLVKEIVAVGGLAIVCGIAAGSASVPIATIPLGTAILSGCLAMTGIGYSTYYVYHDSMQATRMAQVMLFTQSSEDMLVDMAALDEAQSARFWSKLCFPIGMELAAAGRFVRVFGPALKSSAPYLKRLLIEQAAKIATK